jgi:hypothetical protein
MSAELDGVLPDLAGRIAKKAALLAAAAERIQAERTSLDGHRKFNRLQPLAGGARLTETLVASVQIDGCRNARRVGATAASWVLRGDRRGSAVRSSSCWRHQLPQRRAVRRCGACRCRMPPGAR